jgi:DNA-binding response OmpR family regulator
MLKLICHSPFLLKRISGMSERPDAHSCIEDEVRMLELLRKGLYESGYTVMTASDGETGLAAACRTTSTRSCSTSACLDAMGIPWRSRCGRKSATPLLMLTARDAEDDIIRGLDLGADDYMTKPFSFPELVARLQSITRPHREETEPSKSKPATWWSILFATRSLAATPASN